MVVGRRPDSIPSFHGSSQIRSVRSKWPKSAWHICQSRRFFGSQPSNHDLSPSFLQKIEPQLFLPQKILTSWHRLQWISRSMRITLLTLPGPKACCSWTNRAIKATGVAPWNWPLKIAGAAWDLEKIAGIFHSKWTVYQKWPILWP